MKRSQHHDTAKTSGPQLKPVFFDFTHPTAITVCVAGTFNDWQPETQPMHSMGGGHWHEEAVLPPGSYEYCLVVDGQWMPDPLAKETRPNPFGGLNSVLQVASSLQAVHLADAEHAPFNIADNRRMHTR